jgi:hypothetical protein
MLYVLKFRYGEYCATVIMLLANCCGYIGNFALTCSYFRYLSALFEPLSAQRHVMSCGRLLTKISPGDQFLLVVPRRALSKRFCFPAIARLCTTASRRSVQDVSHGNLCSFRLLKSLQKVDSVNLE